MSEDLKERIKQRILGIGFLNSDSVFRKSEDKVILTEWAVDYILDAILAIMPTSLSQEAVEELLRNPPTRQHLGGTSKAWSVRDDGCIDEAGCGVLAQAIALRFASPEIRLPEKDLLPMELQHHQYSPMLNDFRNSIIDEFIRLNPSLKANSGEGK